MISVYGIRNCDTMKKAFAWLDANAVAYRFVDYKAPGVAAARLPAWSAQVGWEALLNTRGLTWRRLPESERRGLDAARAAALMAAHPTLMRRPLVEHRGGLLVGFDAERFAAALGDCGKP